jgi:hypothetical protein
MRGPSGASIGSVGSVCRLRVGEAGPYPYWAAPISLTLTLRDCCIALLLGAWCLGLGLGLGAWWRVGSHCVVL